MNPFVDYLNSLRTQDGATNPNYVEENRTEYLDRIRAAHPSFPDDGELRIPTLVWNLISAMRSTTFSLDVIFLTGDAGDGKTAACVDLARAEGLSRPLRPIDRAGRFTIIKDASELLEEELRQAIARSRSGGEALLVAINEGRLRRLAQTPELKDVWNKIIEPALAAWIDARQAEQLDLAMRTSRIGVVNFRYRMHVRTVAPALLKSWTKVEYWEQGAICGSCPKSETCPILASNLISRGTHCSPGDRHVGIRAFRGPATSFSTPPGCPCFCDNWRPCLQ